MRYPLAPLEGWGKGQEHMLELEAGGSSLVKAGAPWCSAHLWPRDQVTESGSPEELLGDVLCFALKSIDGHDLVNYAKSLSRKNTLWRGFPRVQDQIIAT